MVGREGVVGSLEVIHTLRAIGLRVVQLPGRAVQIAAGAFQEVFISRPRVLVLMHKHLVAELQQILFVSACNRLHSMEERCARWMLMTSDRAGADSFPITQQLLSRMLGVRRATVNVATGMLKKAGFIHYVRGTVTIIDRAGLESASCACYRGINSAYDSILPVISNKSI
jgi:CRP-like cAMP-binding protein